MLTSRKLTNSFGCLYPTHSRELHIHKDEIEFLLLDDFQRGQAIFCQADTATNFF